MCRATSEGESSAAPLLHAQEIRFKSVGLNAVVGSHSAPKMARRGSSCRPFLAHSALRSNQVAELQGLALSDLDRSNKSCGLMVVSGLDTRGPHRLRTRRRAAWTLRFSSKRKTSLRSLVGCWMWALTAAIDRRAPKGAIPRAAIRRDLQNLKVYCTFPAILVSVRRKLRPRGSSCTKHGELRGRVRRHPPAITRPLGRRPYR